jgi:hypothetical protein
MNKFVSNRAIVVINPALEKLLSRTELNTAEIIINSRKIFSPPAQRYAISFRFSSSFNYDSRKTFARSSPFSLAKGFEDAKQYVAIIVVKDL